MYGFPLQTQLRLLFVFLGLGFLLGLLYDAMRFIRLSVSRSKALLIVFDCLFVLTAAGVWFCCSLAANYGRIHAYTLLACAVGFCVYYFTFDAFVRRVTARVVAALRRFYRLIFCVFSLPVRLAVAFVTSVAHVAGIPAKKIHKKIKKLLQTIKVMVYNRHAKKSVQEEQEGCSG